MIFKLKFLFILVDECLIIYKLSSIHYNGGHSFDKLNIYFVFVYLNLFVFAFKVSRIAHLLISFNQVDKLIWLFICSGLHLIANNILIYTVRQKLSTTYIVSIISFLLMNLFQIGLLFSLPVHTYLLICERGYWSIFIDVYMTGCVKCHVYFSTFVFANKANFVLCRVLSFIFYLFCMVRRKLTTPERRQAVGIHNGGFSHRRVADHFRFNHSIIVRLMQRFR